MIVYGSRATQIAQQDLVEKCPTCATPNSITMHVYQKYAHVFWIPFFPIGKTAVSECSHCKQVLKLNQMPPQLSAAYEAMKPQSKTPIWTFAGLALVAVLITIAVISDKNKDQRNAKIILTPRKGDVFEIRTKEDHFTLYKVDLIEGDSVILRTNKYETNKLSGISDLKTKGTDAWSEEQYAFAKSELKKMLETGEIVDIDRD